MRQATHPPIILIGDMDDLHLVAVKDLLSDQVVVVDTVSLTKRCVYFGLDKIVLESIDGELVDFDRAHCYGGWIRRLRPSGWDEGVELGSHRAAILSSQLAMLAALLRWPAIQWLSQVDSLVAAENKLVQYMAAIALGIRVPQTEIALDLSGLAVRLGEPFVLKPLGPGSYTIEEGIQVVFSSPATTEELEGVDLRGAPFIAQQYLSAEAHLRVVTVGEKSWVAELSAEGLPCDWRRESSAHSSFRATSNRREVADMARKLASQLNCGYSSQDWIVDSTGPVFVDLNPGGQWLFLPEPIASEVTMAIANAIRGRCQK